MKLASRHIVLFLFVISQLWVGVVHHCIDLAEEGIELSEKFSGEDKEGEEKEGEKENEKESDEKIKDDSVSNWQNNLNAFGKISELSWHFPPIVKDIILPPPEIIV